MLTGEALHMHPPSLVQDSATPRYHKLVASPLVVGKLFRCGCAVCACNAFWRIPQIDNDPVIHTSPCWSAACLPCQRGRFLHTVAFTGVKGGVGRAEE